MAHDLVDSRSPHLGLFATGTGSRIIGDEAKEPAMRSHSGRESGELPEIKAVSMRVDMGDYAYEVTKELCVETEAVVRWNYMVYKVTPTEVLLSHGKDSPSREHAERNARQIIALSIGLERMEVMRNSTAA
jgi:hypothetical protein